MSAARELASWTAKHRDRLAALPATERDRLIGQRREQLRLASVATPEAQAASGRSARAAAGRMRRFMLAGLSGRR